MADSPAVVVDGLVKRYGARTAVDGLSLAAASGAVTAVLGPNGAGKTSTVECCEGLRRPDAGQVRVLGLDPVRDAHRLRPQVGVMLQDGGLPTGQPARAVLDHMARMYATPADTGALAERLGIDAFARTTVRRLSGGQRQRLALAVALVGRPRLVFLDEPGAGLDPAARRVVWDLVSELRADGVGVVLTTHQMDEAEALADRVVVVDHGRVVAEGTVAELVAAGEDRTLELETSTPFDPASLATDLGPAYRVLTRSATSCAVAGAVTADVVAAVTAHLASGGVLVSRLSVGRRTLEDVFLDLTGHELR